MFQWNILGKKIFTSQKSKKTSIKYLWRYLKKRQKSRLFSLLSFPLACIKPCLILNIYFLKLNVYFLLEEENCKFCNTSALAKMITKHELIEGILKKKWVKSKTSSKLFISPEVYVFLTFLACLRIYCKTDLLFVSLTFQHRHPLHLKWMKILQEKRLFLSS